MKTLFTLLIALISINGMGQDPWKYFPEEDTSLWKKPLTKDIIYDTLIVSKGDIVLAADTNVIIDTISFPFISHEEYMAEQERLWQLEWEQRLLKTLKEYQKYCESDSALFEIDYWIYPVDTATDVIKYKRTDLDEYIEKHKFKKCECYDDGNYQVYLKPQMTLEGFIEWLERRGRND